MSHSLLDPSKITIPVFSPPNSSLSTAAIAGIIVSVIAILFLLGGAAFVLMRRKSLTLPFSTSKPKISYPMYSESRHELHNRDITKFGVWPDACISKPAAFDGVRAQAVELGSHHPRGQAWELSAADKEG